MGQRRVHGGTDQETCRVVEQQRRRQRAALPRSRLRRSVRPSTFSMPTTPAPLTCVSSSCHARPWIRGQEGGAQEDDLRHRQRRKRFHRVPEFLEMMTGKMGEKDTREDIEKVFKLFDDDNTGKISLRNL